MDTDYMNKQWEPYGIMIIINNQRNFENVEKLDSYTTLRKIELYKKDSNGWQNVANINRMSTGPMKYKISFQNNTYYPPYKKEKWGTPEYYRHKRTVWELTNKGYSSGYNVMGIGYLKNCQVLLNFLSSEVFRDFMDQATKINTEGDYISFQNQLELRTAIENI